MAALADALIYEDLEPELMTVEQYRALPPREDVIQDLHWGQVVGLCWPKIGHTKIQVRLVELLAPKARQLGVVASEVPFRALPEYDVRGADVAFVSRERWEAASDDDNLHGSPEIVMEVLSPSNTKKERQEKAALYLATGAQEFWLVDPKRKSVSVFFKSGERAFYQAGERMPLRMFDGELDVSSIFE